jgi:hypothetical protein
MLKGVPGEASEGVDRFATSYLKILDIIEARRAEAGG